MTVLNFPASPIDGDIFTQNDIQWQYDVTYNVWNIISSGPTGYSGSLGYTGSKGITYISNLPPLNPINGDTWYNTEDGIRYVYYIDIDSAQWVQESAPGADGPPGPAGYTGSRSTAEGYAGSLGYTGSIGYAGSVGGASYVANSAPLSPDPGDTWYNSDDGIRYIYYIDDDSTAQWVQESAPGPSGYTGSRSTVMGYSGSFGYTGSTGPIGVRSRTFIDSVSPPNPENGDTWFNSVDGIRYIYYVDINLTGQWVQESAPGSSGYTGSSSNEPGPLGYTGSIGVRSRSFISNTAPSSPVNGDTWYNSDDGIRYIYYIDVDSTAQWVQESAPGPSGYTGSQGIPKIPLSGSEKTTSYQLNTGDIGKLITVGTGGSIIIPDATFSTGDLITIFNNTSSNIPITCNITTSYITGTDVDQASVALATRGKTTILFISGTLCVMDGNVFVL